MDRFLISPLCFLLSFSLSLSLPFSGRRLFVCPACLAKVRLRVAARWCEPPLGRKMLPWWGWRIKFHPHGPPTTATFI